MLIRPLPSGLVQPPQGSGSVRRCDRSPSHRTRPLGGRPDPPRSGPVELTRADRAAASGGDTVDDSSVVDSARPARVDNPPYVIGGSAGSRWSLPLHRGTERAHPKPFPSPGASCGRHDTRRGGGRCTGSTRLGALPVMLRLRVGSGRSPSTPLRVNPLPKRFTRWCREAQGRWGVAGVRRRRVHTESSSRSGAPRPPSRSRRIRSAREVELRTVEAEQSMIRATSSMLRSSQ